MRRLYLFTALFAILAGGVLSPALAVASVRAIYQDCETNGKLTRSYPRSELQAALNQMPSEVAEYSACSDIIQQALLRASSHGGHGATTHGPLAGGSGGGRGGSGGSGGSGGGGRGGHGGKAGDPAASTGSAGGGGSGLGLGLTGGDIRPGSTGSGGSLPPALIVVLILLALTAVSGAAVAIRRRVVARHLT